MFRNTLPFIRIARGLLSDIWATFRIQTLTKSYLLALTVLFLAVLFSFLALNPILYSFVYPLF
jgi:hypothetical protein